jgi:hypothetical protein
MAIPEAKLRELDSQIRSGKVQIGQVRNDVLAEYEAWKAPAAAAAPVGMSRPYVEGEGNLDPMSEVMNAAGVGFKNLGAQALGALETATTLATSIPAQIGAGYAGIVAGIRAPSGERLSAAVDAINSVSGTFTYQPRTQAAQSQLGGLATILSPITEGIETASEFSADVTGSPAVGAGVKTLLEVGPMFFGVKNPISATRSNLAAAREANAIIRSAGIDPNLPVAEQISRVPAAAAVLANDAKQTALNFNIIQDGVKRQFGNARTMVRSMYDEAKKAGTVAVDINQVRVLDGAMADSLALYDPATIGPMNGLLRDFAKKIGSESRGVRDVKLDPVPGRRLGGLPDKMERIVTRNEWRSKGIRNQEIKQSVIELNDIADFRKRVSALTRAPDATVSAAATTARHHIDEWFNAQLTNDLVSGSADAITKWKSATGAYKEMFDNYRSENAIKSLIDKQATPETVKKWIYGMSAMGANTQAGQVVMKLKNILGDSSPEIEALRQGVMFDIVEPILTANIGEASAAAFMQNVAQVRAKKPTLWANMFSPQDMGALESLSKVVSAAGKIEFPKALVKDVNQALAVVLFPKAHPIRAGQVTLSLIDRVIQRVRSVNSPSAKMQYLEQLSGVGMTNNMFSAKTPAMAAIVQTVQDQEAMSASDMIRRLSGR